MLFSFSIFIETLPYPCNLSLTTIFRTRSTVDCNCLAIVQRLRWQLTPTRVQTAENQYSQS